MLSDRMLRRARATLILPLMMAAGAAAAQTPPPRGPSMLPRQESAPPGLDNLPGGGRPNADPMQMLLNSRKLQAELRMSEGQLRKLKRIEPEFISRQSELLRRMTPGNSPERIRSARMALHAHMEVARGMIARVLTRPQLERFRQIMVQVQGTCSALRDEDVSHALRLQPAQMREITGLCRRLHDVVKAPPPAGSRKERCAAIQKIRVSYEKAREQTEAEIAEVLSNGQRSVLRSMAGRPFQMDAPLPPECR
jgi:hypothetical protein